MMEPSTYMTLWGHAMAVRDVNVVNLTIMALAIIFTWCLQSQAPKRVQVWLYRSYLVGGMLLYGVTLGVAFWAVIYG